MSSRQASSGRWMAALCLALVALGGLLGWWIGRRGGASEELRDSGPILQAMQHIGQLHTVSFQFKDVLTKETDRKPEGWLQDIPGAETVAHWATHNQVTVVANGSVEAGLDLSRLSERDITRTRQPDGKEILNVHLPPVILYAPDVHINVENHQPGLLWHDENIVPKAQEEAGRRFQEAAEKGGIRLEAQANAVRMLEQIQRALGYRNVRFYF